MELLLRIASFREMGNLRRLRPPPADARERRNGRAELERVNRTISLRRLGIGHLDLWYAHFL